MMNELCGRTDELAKRLIVALDVSEYEQAIQLVDQLQPLGLTFKVGMELFYSEGMRVVDAIQERGCFTFVDLKLHDIPTTVRKASQSLASQGVGFFNVHCSGGQAMMEAAVEGARSGAQTEGRNVPLVIGVTVLTSTSPEVLRDELKVEQPLQDYVVHCALQAQSAGLDGVVCSAQEAPLIRNACGDDFLLVSPGIRPHVAGQTRVDDQVRVLTPSQALQNGSDYLVIGRPITQSAEPLEAAQAILHEMALAVDACSAAQ